jgi:uncharacterized membrane protein YvbJ
VRVCSNCGQENPERARFCLNCGAALARGRVLLRPGVTSEARKVLGEARKLFARLGATVLLAEVDQMVKGSIARSG